jgi:hypothetical protein
VKHSSSGYVTRFRVRRSFPAEDLSELNANIIGVIELVAEYHQDESTPGNEEKKPPTIYAVDRGLKISVSFLVGACC